MSSLLAASLLWMTLAQTEPLHPGAAPGPIASEASPAIPGDSSREAGTGQALEREDARQSGQPEASDDEPEEETESEESGDNEEEEEEPEEDERPPALFGSFLHGRGGITAEYLYTGEVFTNARGGLNTNRATEYNGLLDLMLTADLDEIGFFPGGTFFIWGQNHHGQGLTDQHVGDFQVLSNIDAPDFTQVSEYWWERSIWDNCLTFRIGKQDANSSFGFVDMAADFVQSSYGFHPTIPMPSYPDPSMAAVVFFRPRESMVLMAGVWDGRPDGGNWGFSGSGVTFSIAEMHVEYELSPGQPGRFHAGLWYHSDEWADLTPGSDRMLRGMHGTYCGWEQLVLPENPDDEDDEQGLGVFAQYGWAPQDRSEAHQYFGAGLVYTGLIPERDEDRIGLGVATVTFSGLLPDYEPETAIELYYKAQITPWMMLQPDLQYIADPGGTGRDALAVGLRFSMAL